MLRLKICDLATPRNAGYDEDRVLPRPGRGRGGQGATGNGAGAKELMLQRWTKNSLFLRKSVEWIAWRGHRSSKMAATPAQSQQREQMHMAAAHREQHNRMGRGAAPQISLGRYIRPRYTFKSPAVLPHSCALRALACSAGNLVLSHHDVTSRLLVPTGD